MTTAAPTEVDPREGQVGGHWDPPHQRIHSEGAAFHAQGEVLATPYHPHLEIAGLLWVAAPALLARGCSVLPCEKTVLSRVVWLEK